jgi:hypothetical protein
VLLGLEGLVRLGHHGRRVVVIIFLDVRKVHLEEDSASAIVSGEGGRARSERTRVRKRGQEKDAVGVGRRKALALLCASKKTRAREGRRWRRSSKGSSSSLRSLRSRGGART